MIANNCLKPGTINTINTKLITKTNKRAQNFVRLKVKLPPTHTHISENIKFSLLSNFCNLGETNLGELNSHTVKWLPILKMTNQFFFQELTSENEKLLNSCVIELFVILMIKLTHSDCKHIVHHFHMHNDHLKQKRICWINSARPAPECTGRDPIKDASWVWASGLRSNDDKNQKKDARKWRWW